MEVLRARVCPWDSPAIQCLSFAPTHAEPRLALGRECGALELWDTTCWQARVASPGRVKRSIRSIVWFPRSGAVDEAAEDPAGLRAFYLYTAGFNGQLVQYDTLTLEPIRAIESGGGRVWTMCLVPGKRQLVLGCEDGSIRLFAIPGVDEDDRDGEVQYTGKHIQVANTRLISSAMFGADDIFVGGIDSRITRWCLSTRSCEGKMTLEKPSQSETLVWCMAVLSSVGDDAGGGLLATGDSLGLVQVWDCNTYVLLQRFHQHQADVLCLAASSDGRTFIAGSTDTKLSIYSVSSLGRYVNSGSDFIHTHDIAALAIDDGPHANGESRGHTWVSGGVAGKLLVHATKGRRPHDCSPFSAFFHKCSVAVSGRIALCQASTYLELWYLDQPQSTKDLQDCHEVEVGTVQVDDKFLPRTQLIVRLQLSNEPQSSPRHITASDICNDGTMVAVSDLKGLRVFHIELKELQVTRDRGLPPLCRNTPARALRFCGTGHDVLAMATWRTHEVLLIDPSQGVLHCMQEHTAPVTLLEATSEWLASSDSEGVVHLTNLDRQSHFCRVPTSSCKGVFPTAMAFTDRGQLIIVLSSHEVLVYSIGEEAVSIAAGLAGLKVPRKLLRPNQRIAGVTLCPDRPELVFLWGETFLMALNVDMAARPAGSAFAEIPDTSTDQDRRRLAPDCITTIGAWRMYPKMKHCLGFHALAPSMWGKPTLLNHELVPPVAPPSKRKPESAEQDEHVAKRRTTAKTCMLSLEVSPDKVKELTPPSFERKRHQARNLLKKS